jgi:HD-like signal output (HDOD) protein/CheY-like chemotaxis protein
MKNRILFVDDDPLVLQGLQRMLRSMRQEWEMEFVDGAASALARLAEASFDVVVSDMRMPGMNGAELLDEVMKRHPQTVRLILSGHADRELILRCVGATHQYLAKPCDAEDLKLTIARAANSEKSLQSETLRRLVAKMDRLPSLPMLYSAIVEKCQDPESGLEDIARIVASDLGMTAKILKLVNSAFFGLGRPIADVQEAVAYLGIETIKALVLTLHAFSQFEDSAAGSFSFPELWRHSTEIAAAAKAIAQFEEADRKLMDEAFVSGMLHDTGKLVLAFNFPESYEASRRAAHAQGLPILAAEREAFGASHAEVGGYLLGLWGLPVGVVEAIALHHTPQLSTAGEFGPLTAVHVANCLAREMQPESSLSGRPELDLVYLETLELAGRIDGWRQCLSDPS